MESLIGTKIGMTRVFDDRGAVKTVTLVDIGPNSVIQVKSEGVDGYAALVLGAGNAKKLSKPLAGHVKKSGSAPAVLREVSYQTGEYKVGDKFDVTIFNIGDIVDAVGVSKGKGFAGTVKRHNFTTGPKTHGSRNYRKPGSIGVMYPEHVTKGKRMAGRLGGARTTVKNLRVFGVEPQSNLLLLEGSVPGPNLSAVLITRRKAFAAPKEQENAS